MPSADLTLEFCHHPLFGYGLCGFRVATARPATDSSDPLTSLRFGDRSQKRKRQKLLIRLDHLAGFILAG